MDLLIEGAEAMIGEHQEAIFLEAELIDGGLDFAHELIELEIPLLDDLRVRSA